MKSPFFSVRDPHEVMVHIIFPQAFKGNLLFEGCGICLLIFIDACSFQTFSSSLPVIPTICFC